MQCGKMPWYFISVNNSIADIAADPDIHGNTGALCFEWGFTRTYPRIEDVAVKQKLEVVYVKFW